jgi:hypothetical protein
MNIFLEAILVGLAFLPIYWATEKLGQGKWVTLFIAGGLFHLVAEFTGVNAAYVRSKV